MAKSYSSVVGIDIGSQTIKVAEVRKQGSGASITAMGMVPTPEGTVDHTGVHDPNLVGEAVKVACAQAGVSVGDAVVSLAGQNSVLVRTIEVSSMNDSDLKDHMGWEITRSIPFAETTVVSDYKAFPKSDPAAQHMDVVMAIATQSSVDTVNSMLKKATKKAAAYDVEPLAVARDLDFCYGSTIGGKQVCIVEVGHKTTSIHIYKGAHLAIPRQVPLGGEMFTQAIADNLGVSFDEAEQMKCNQADLPSSVAPMAFDGGATQQVTSYNPFVDSPTPQDAPVEDAPSAEASAPAPAPAQDGDAAKITGALSQILDEFVAEVRRSVDFYRTKGGDVDLILVTGGGGKLKGLDKFLGSSVGIDCEMMDPTRNFDMSLKKQDSGFDGSNAQDFTVAVGNGLHICY